MVRSRCLPGRRLTVRHVAQAPKNSVVRTSAADSLLVELLVLICFEDGQGSAWLDFFAYGLWANWKLCGCWGKIPHFTNKPGGTVIAWLHQLFSGNREPLR